MSIDYLEKFAEDIGYRSIQQLRAERQLWLNRESNAAFKDALELIPAIQSDPIICDSTVRIGKLEELTPTQKEHLEDALKTFIPWRKGPFEVFGTYIDAEWKSDLKWERVLPVLDSLKGKKVADIGCNNGYYMFRMAAHEPDIVIGLDPTVRYWYTFQFLQRFAQIDCLHFELLGVEHIDFFPSFFDTIFCMGILYHHPDPVGMLRKIWKAMKPQGQLIVETLGIPGETSTALFPEKRYAKVPGTWFVPTQICLVNWLQRSGFREVTPFYAQKLTSNEQRKTKWAPFESLEDFLDPEDDSKTVEGYPAPWRFYVHARKPKA
ncbi:MAG: tRNA 5-methoxyuridine(34)/uridine 5-oxyacetic acid(34) synthase CmoB [SAR324 cluster bacterium]|nr:tRNA 5-methoxyuridine(34)/uridine 5-oxyacetic acid(34) synthase CmoB [SAR324 cluster bacterium]